MLNCYLLHLSGMETSEPSLKRTLTLPLVTFYGLGNILGAGIYVLIGKVAAEAGYFSPLSFFIASLVAAISAFSYAELSSRYPESAGEAVYVYEGFGVRQLSLLVGLLIVFAGIVSSAAIAIGFAGYVQVLFDVPRWLSIVLMLMVLGLLAIWGISQSVRIAAALTVVEIIGLLIIIFIGVDQLPLLENYYKQSHLLSQGYAPQGFTMLGIISGAFLAFYAYLGFEDMVNVAEEVKDAQRTMPRAIMLSVIISTLLYSLVSLVSVSVLTPAELSRSDAPLADVYYAATGRPPLVISVIGIFAVINGALIQIIMTSRLLYGMANRGWLPAFLASVFPVTRIPLNSTLLTVGLMMLFALTLPIVTLAELTSYFILLVFVLVNLALIKIKQKHPAVVGVRVFSIWLPRLGFIASTLFLAVKLVSDFIA